MVLPSGPTATHYAAEGHSVDEGKVVRSVRSPSKVVCVACGVALAVMGAAAALGAFLTDGSAGPDSDQARSTSSAVTAEAKSVLRRLERAGLPLEHPVTMTPTTDPDHLLGHADGYRSKVTFEDGRVDGGLVADNDPGSVALGGIIEVFGDARSAQRRAEQLQRKALDIPARAEHGYLAGRVLLRLSPYLDEEQAEEYGQVLGARPVPAATRPPDIREA